MSRETVAPSNGHAASLRALPPPIGDTGPLQAPGNFTFCDGLGHPSGSLLQPFRVVLQLSYAPHHLGRR